MVVRFEKTVGSGFSVSGQGVSLNMPNGMSAETENDSPVIIAIDVLEIHLLFEGGIYYQVARLGESHSIL